MSTRLYVSLAIGVSPFTGAAVGHWQACCLHFSEMVALVLSPFLILGFVVRFIPWFEKHTATRAVLSWGGLSLWCLGAPYSCLHALS
jgi:hypothetical protein